MAAYPPMVRKRIIELYDGHFKTKQIAELFGVSKSGTRRVRQRLRERGTLDPLPSRPGRKPQLTADVQQRIRDHIAAHPDATREELKTSLALTVSLQSISKWLKKLGLVLKKSRFTPPSSSGRTSRRDARSGTRS
jgi:transposase